VKIGPLGTSAIPTPLRKPTLISLFTVPKADVESNIAPDFVDSTSGVALSNVTTRRPCRKEGVYSYTSQQATRGYNVRW